MENTDTSRGIPLQAALDILSARSSPATLAESCAPSQAPKGLVNQTLNLGPNTCTADDFQALHAIGQGAHGTTRLVRRKQDGRLLCSKHQVAELFWLAKK